MRFSRRVLWAARAVCGMNGHEFKEQVMTCRTSLMLCALAVVLGLSQPTRAGIVSVSPVQGIPAGNISLTTEGTIDWAHWGFGSTVGGGAGPISINHKDAGGGTPVGLISDFTFNSTHHNPGPYGYNSLLGDIGVTLSWTDGTPTSSSAGPTGAYVFGNVAANGQGFTFTVPAAAEARTLRVYGGVFSNAGSASHAVDLLATLSGSGSDSQIGVVMPTGDGTGNNAYGYFDIDFSGAGETLTVQWLSGGFGGATARNVKLIGATLVTAQPVSPIPEPSSLLIFAGGAACLFFPFFCGRHRRRRALLSAAAACALAATVARAAK